MQDVYILGYISINFTLSILKFIVVLLILNALTEFDSRIFSDKTENTSLFI